MPTCTVTVGGPNGETVGEFWAKVHGLRKSSGSRASSPEVPSLHCVEIFLQIYTYALYTLYVYIYIYAYSTLYLICS